MEEVRVGNISISITRSIVPELLALLVEFKNNTVLEKVEPYQIYAFPLYDHDIEIDDEMIRQSKHPVNGNEKWVGPHTSVFKSKDYMVYETLGECRVYCNDFPIFYGFLRAKLTELIRNALLKKAIGGLHAAFISREDKNFIILGAKGAGKSSTVLHAYHEGWQVATDEFVCIDEKMELDFLFRLPSLGPATIERYFDQVHIPLKRKQMFVSQLTQEKKVMIDIELTHKKLKLEDIDAVFLLVKNETQITCNPVEIKMSLFSSNWIDGQKIAGFDYLLRTLLEKSEMTHVAKLRKYLSDLNVLDKAVCM